MTLSRLEYLDIGTKRIRLPVYFPSISSVKTTLDPHEYLLFLSSFIGVNNQFLISAFDLAHTTSPEVVHEKLISSRLAGATTLMDSGNYESFWKDAQEEWKQENFHRALNNFPCDLAFCFDEQNPPNDHSKHVDLIISRLQEDKKFAGECYIIPIVHAHFSDLPNLCALVAKISGTQVIAIAERELGDGIYNRAKTVRSIRTKLNKLQKYIALHLLGTGDPISMAIYTATGADSFDGLEWCQTVVDYDSGFLHHFSHADFFSKQTSWGDSNFSFQAKTLAHNLEFYSNWINQLQNAMSQDRIFDFCRHNLPNKVYQQLSLL